MIRAKDGNGCCSSWCCCIRQQIAELWQRIEGTVRGVKMNGNIIEPDGDGIVDLDVNFPVDGAMDPTSVNPVQNRIVTDAILTERNERIGDDRRHDLQIQGLETEMRTKLTTPSGGVQGQVLGKGAQGIGWVDTITEQRAQQMETEISGKQDTLVSGTNIKTIGGESVLGSGDLNVQGGITPHKYATLGALAVDIRNNPNGLLTRNGYGYVQVGIYPMWVSLIFANAIVVADRNLIAINSGYFINLLADSPDTMTGSCSYTELTINNDNTVNGSMISDNAPVYASELTYWYRATLLLPRSGCGRGEEPSRSWSVCAEAVQCARRMIHAHGCARRTTHCLVGDGLLNFW